MIRLYLTLGCLAAAATSAWAQADPVDGYMSVLVSVMPDVDEEQPRSQRVVEARTRLFVKKAFDVGQRLHVNLSGHVDALAADREPFGAPGTSTDAVARPHDFYAELRFERADVRAGFSTIVWGRLDELQPSDVVNPIDVSRFFLEGRSEARLPVALVRGRLFLPHATTLEAIVVPWFRAGRFDQLAEPTSPFNLSSPQTAICPAGPGSCFRLATVREEREATLSNAQGGARVTTTVGRVDVGAAVWRGIEPFPSFTLRTRPVPGPGQPIRADILESFPRYTMVAADFETVRGPWGVRGEVAYFPDDTLQSLAPVAPVAGRSVEAGFGVDRRAGSYRVSGNVLVSHREADDRAAAREGLVIDPDVGDTDVTLIGWTERSFARETRTVRVLGLYNPADDSAFVRAIAGFSLRDNLSLEASAGLLQGDGIDTIGRLSTRDFVYARLKVHF